MNRENWKTVHELLIACCAEMFAGCGAATECEGALIDGQPMAEGVIAFIGFSGEAISGSLALVMPESLVSRTHPMNGRIVGDARAALHDWAGEISNQVLGSFKNRLLAHGVVLQLSTPITLEGRHLRGGTEGRDGCVRLRFAAGEQRFDLHFDATAAPEFVLPDAAPAGADDGAANGDCFLF